MRTIGRVLGWLLLAAGLVAGGLDVWNSIQEEELSLIPLGQHWFEISTSSLNAAQAGIERHLWAPLWRDVIQPLLEQPASLVLTALGLLLLLVTRRRGGPPRWFRGKK